MNNGIHQVKLICDICVLAEMKVLLVKYKDSNKYDHQKGWFLADDVINFNEHPDDAAARILKEQLDCESSELKLHHMESFIGNDKSWHLIFHYEVYLENMHLVKCCDEIESYEWFDYDELPDEKDVAHHGWAKFTVDEILNNPI